MLVHHHHVDPRRALRIFVVVWLLLLILLLVPIRTHAQNLGQPPNSSVEIINDAPTLPPAELVEIMAAEIVLLVSVMISYLVVGARHHHVTHHRHVPHLLQ